MPCVDVYGPRPIATGRRVDGQIKRSFGSKEDAVTAGAAIRKAYPIVVVTVVDTEEIINA